MRSFSIAVFAVLALAGCRAPDDQSVSEQASAQSTTQKTGEFDEDEFYRLARENPMKYCSSVIPQDVSEFDAYLKEQGVLWVVGDSPSKVVNQKPASSALYVREDRIMWRQISGPRLEVIQNECFILPA